MTSSNPPNTKPDAASAASSNAGLEEALSPFYAVAAKFVQANLLARETAARQRVQACLDLQDEVRSVEQDASRAAAQAMRKQLENLGQQAGGSVEQMFAARAGAQVDFERELRQIAMDTQAKLTTISQRAFSTASAANLAQQDSTARQEAFRTYLSDLQQAWASTRSLDPQTMTGIASSILLTMSAVNQLC